MEVREDIDPSFPPILFFMDRPAMTARPSRRVGPGSDHGAAYGVSVRAYASEKYFLVEGMTIARKMARPKMIVIYVAG